MKILELFGGIGACSKAFKRLGIDIEIADYVEIDKYAVKSYNAINGTNFEPQDITKWDKDIEVDFIMHGSPCQDFSIAGKGAGGDEGSGTRSSLMYETIRIVKKLKPKYVLWENVRNLLSKKHKHNFDNYIKEINSLGYNSYYQILNAKNYGIPQNRERVFTLSIRQDVDNGTFTFPKPIELKLKLKDMLEDNVDEKYFLSDRQIENIKKTNFNVEKNRIQSKEYASTLCARDWKSPKCVDEIYIKNNTKKGYLIAKDGDGVYTNVSTKRGTVQKEMIQTLTEFLDKGVVTAVAQRKRNNGQQIEISNREYTNSLTTVNKDSMTKQELRIRRLTPREYWRLMGFDDTDFEKAEKVNSNAQLYKQAGNSIVVNVLERILENLFLKEENDFEGQMDLNMLGDNI